MKIYRVAYYSEYHGSHGFSYHTSELEAKKKLAAFKKNDVAYFDNARSGITMREIPIGKVEFIQLLNEWAGHADIS